MSGERVVVRGGEHDCIDGIRRGLLGRQAVRKQRERSVRSKPRPRAAGDDALRAALLGAQRRGAVPHLDEHRDAVTLGNRLTQPSVGHEMRMVMDRFREPGLRHAVGSRVVSGVKRVCLLGAESTGKSTLAEALAKRFDTLWNPEYGRPYTLVGRPAGAPWTSWEFTHIARIHCWYEDFLATLAREVLFSDTDAFTTSVFHEVYLGTPATGFEELIDRRYDLYVVCGLDVPWRHDGIREFEEQRRSMHERYLERARTSASPWLLAEGALETRLEAVANEVERLLAGP